MNMFKTVLVVGLLCLVGYLWSAIARDRGAAVQASNGRLVEVLRTLEEVGGRIDRAEFEGLSPDAVPSPALLDEIDREATTDNEHEALVKIRMACTLQRNNIVGITKQNVGQRNARNTNSTVWKYIEDAKGRLSASASSLLAGRGDVPSETIDHLRPWITPLP